MKRKQPLAKRLLADVRRTSRYVGHGRLVRLGLVALMVGSLMIPVMQQIRIQQLYTLDAATRQLVGTTNPNLAKKFSYDASNQQWQFNKEGLTPDLSNAKSPDEVAAALKSQVGGGGTKDSSLYSVNLPTSGQKGITYYDNNTDLSFTLVPRFDVRSGAEREGQLIYPIQDGVKLIYSAKNNGMKEDIVLSHNIGDSLQFTYQLNLPDTLEAKLLDDGSIGVYSADPSLFGNIKFGSDMDQAKIESARRTAPKDHLVFNIPAPIIKQTDNEQVKAGAKFSLEGNELKIYATNLNSLTYPASVDPTVVVTSSSDFSSGNDEGNISYGNNQIARSGLTGGTVGTWATTNDTGTGIRSSGSVAYNGYMYIAGGATASGANETTVSYAQLNSNGTTGTWATTSPLNQGRVYNALVAYNGYLYAYGGYSGSTALSSVEYAKVNSNGTVSSWTVSSNTMGTAVCRFGYAVYNGYLYATAGADGSTSPCGNTSNPLNIVQYAQLKATGDTGTWQTSSTTLPDSRHSNSSVAYNGYLYVVGGTVNGTGGLTTAYYGKIGSNGDVTSWLSTTSLPYFKSRFGLVAANGYMYTIGGESTSSGDGSFSSVTRYAQINANGSLGSWTLTTAFTTGRWGANVAAYNGYVYMQGGTSGSNPLSDVQYAKISAAGSVSPTQTTTSLPVTLQRGAAIAYNGYVYMVGGATAGTFSSRVSTVYYAAVNSDGSLGSWNTTSSLMAGNRDVDVEIYGGYMYEIDFGSRKVQYAKINSSGTLGTWAYSTTYPAVALQFPGFAAYNGYLYITGGWDQTTDYNYVQYAPLNSDGTVGAWHYTHNSTDDGTTFVDGFNIARRSHTTVAYGGYLYVIGGITNIGTYGTLDDVQYAPINTDGTIGSWTTDPSSVMLDSGRYYQTESVYNGCLYVYGGVNASSTITGNIDYACFNANGTMTSWTTTSTLTLSREYLSGAMYNGYIYAMGGVRVSPTATVDTVDYARVNNGGSGLTGAWTANSTDLTSPYPNGWTYGQSFAANGYLYTVGGYTATGGATEYSAAWYAPIAADGSVGSWTATSSMTVPRYNFGLQVYNGFVYAIAGMTTAGAYLTSVEYAPINSNGTLGTWVDSGHAITNARDYPTVAAYNGYLYSLGGRNGGTKYNDSQYVHLNSDGSIGSWAATTSFTGARLGQRSIAYNGYIYIVGGQTAVGYQADVQYAQLNSSDGTIGSWSRTTNMSFDRISFAIAAANGFLYVWGGTSSSGGRSDVQYVAINSNGTLGRWQYGSTMTGGARNSSAYAVYGGYLYNLGGFASSGPTYFTDVQYAPIHSIARSAHYSKLIDLGTSATLNSISFNGTLTGGAKNILYRTAGDDGVLGSAATVDTITGGGGGAVTCGGASTPTRYVWVSVTIDDTAGVIFPDTASIFGNVTDITVDYAAYNNGHAPPNLRLRGGKYFSNESLQPLDTCGA